MEISGSRQRIPIQIGFCIKFHALKSGDLYVNPYSNPCSITYFHCNVI